PPGAPGPLPRGLDAVPGQGSPGSRTAGALRPGPGPAPAAPGPGRQAGAPGAPAPPPAPRRREKGKGIWGRGLRAEGSYTYKKLPQTLSQSLKGKRERLVSRPE